MASMDEREAAVFRKLGVAKGCNDEALTKAYRKLAMKWHPDRATAGAEQKAEQMFKEVTEAYNRAKQINAGVMPEGMADARGPQWHRNMHRQQRYGRAADGRATGPEFRNAYPRASEVPSSAPQRILMFAGAVGAACVFFNVFMMRRTWSPSNDLKVGRPSLIKVSKEELNELWHDFRRRQNSAEEGTSYSAASVTHFMLAKHGSK